MLNPRVPGVGKRPCHCDVALRLADELSSRRVRGCKSARKTAGGTHPRERARIHDDNGWVSRSPALLANVFGRTATSRS
jgi:hypothetical protein